MNTQWIIKASRGHDQASGITQLTRQAYRPIASRTSFFVIF